MVDHGIDPGDPPAVACTTVQTNPPPAGYTETSQDCDPGTDQTDPQCQIVNEISTDTIRVQKVFDDGSGGTVDVTIVCDSGNVDATNTTTNTKTVAGGGFVSFNIQGFNQVTDASGQATNCTITEDNIPADYYQVSAVGCEQTLIHQDNSELCIFTNGATTANFWVYKEYGIFELEEDLDIDTPVEVKISCNMGTPINDTSVIDPGLENFVRFTVKDFTNGDMRCEVREVVPEGYVAGYYSDGQDADEDIPIRCVWRDVEGGANHVCAIWNGQKKSQFEVNKEWIDDNPAFNGDERVKVRISCDNPLWLGIGDPDEPFIPDAFDPLPPLEQGEGRMVNPNARVRWRREPAGRRSKDQPAHLDRPRQPRLLVHLGPGKQHRGL